MAAMTHNTCADIAASSPKIAFISLGCPRDTLYIQIADVKTPALWRAF